jgi:hypothetical protein
MRGATEFTDDPQLGDPLWVIAAFQRFPDLCDELIERTTVHRRDGRRRMEGSWALVMLAFVLTRQADIEPFYTEQASSLLWERCGFASVPSYQTTYLRLTELEEHYQAFIDVANKLIRRAVEHEPRIARQVYVDGTGIEANAVLQHCCPDRDACRALREKAEAFQRAPLAVIHEAKADEVVEAPTAGRRSANALEKVPFEESPQEFPPRRTTPYSYWRQAGHLYRVVDPDAAPRRYAQRGRKPAFWLGGIDQATISFFVGAPLAVAVFPADEHEHHHYPAILDATEQATGCRPEAVAADRGYSIKAVFELNTRRGIASSIAWRKPSAGFTREMVETDLYDRHGIPRCQHCGGPGDIEASGVGLYFARGKPRLRYRCTVPTCPLKGHERSIACEMDWRMLVPLSRRTETYHSLSTGRSNLERVWRHWRERYGLAGNDVFTRPRRVGLGWERLRLAVALMAEWFRLDVRHGWLGSPRRARRTEVVKWRGERRLNSTLRARARHGLDLPYGANAVANGFAVAPEPPPGGDDPPPF